MNRIPEIWKLWNPIPQKKNRDSVYVRSLGCGVRRVKDVKRLGEMAAQFNADHQELSAEVPIWDCIQLLRMAQSVVSSHPCFMPGEYMTNRGHYEPCLAMKCSKIPSSN